MAPLQDSNEYNKHMIFKKYTVFDICSYPHKYPQLTNVSDMPTIYNEITS